MPTYILLGNFTDQGIRNVKETTKRVEVVRGIAQKLGITVKESYWTMGQFDVALIVDAPDDVRRDQGRQDAEDHDNDHDFDQRETGAAHAPRG